MHQRPFNKFKAFCDLENYHFVQGKSSN
jgi:hypothetical protein